MSTRNTTLCGAYKLLRGQLDKTSLHGGENSACYLLVLVTNKFFLKIKPYLLTKIKVVKETK